MEGMIFSKTEQKLISTKLIYERIIIWIGTKPQKK